MGCNVAESSVLLSGCKFICDINLIGWPPIIAFQRLKRPQSFSALFSGEFDGDQNVFVAG